MPPVAGEQVGPYLIERELGRGGMGVVYLARDTRLDRAVAIKALPEDMAADPERLARFEREARSLAQLSHPSIASIYGVEEHAGDRYLVLEFVEGETLEDRLDRGPLPPDEAVELAAQIAGGLAVAHDAGVIHRDLKPANVIVTPEGRAAILDFGLARIDEGRSSTSVDRDAATLTTPAHSPTIAGVIMGTAAYMSPEQARGRRVDKRSDVWSFGVVLYEMLTGLRPFAGETVSDSIGAILHKTIDLDRLPDGTPPNAARVIERCTARDRDDRYRDLGDARLDLLEPAGRAASGAEARRPGGVGPLLAIALAAVFGAAGLLAGLLQGAGWGERTEPTVVDLVAPDGYEFEYAMLSPDGRTVAARCDVIGSGVDAWFIRDLDTPAWRRLPDSERSANGTFSPDGRYFVYKAPIEVGARDSRLLKLDLESDLPPTEILAPPVYLYEPEAEVHWLRSGELFLQSDRGRSILPIDPETGEIGEPLALRRAEGDVALDLCESVVPGLILAEVTRYTDRGYQNDAVAIVLATGEVVDLVPNARPNAAADGLLYFSRFDTLFAAPFDIETLEVGTPRQIGTDLRTYNPWEHAFFSLSEAGDLLHLPGGRVGLRRLIKRGTLEGELVTLPFEPRSYDDRLDISPDESKIATTIASAGGLFEIWVSSMERPRWQLVRSEPRVDVAQATFLPDNRRLLVTLNGGEESWFEVIDSEGIEPPRRVSPALPIEIYYVMLTVHRSGEWAAAMRLNDQRPPEIVRISLLEEAEPEIWLTGPAAYGAPRFSPDGTMLAYMSDSSGRSEVYVRSISDEGELGPASPVTDGGALDLEWVGDGSEIPLRLHVLTRGAVDEYLVTPGDRPEVSEPRRTGYDMTAEETVAIGDTLSDGSYIAAYPGQDEKPATHARLILGGLRRD